jgi:hypothetical protein
MNAWSVTHHLIISNTNQSTAVDKSLIFEYICNKNNYRLFGCSLYTSLLMCDYAQSHIFI